jgi:hypothetical protein
MHVLKFVFKRVVLVKEVLVDLREYLKTPADFVLYIKGKKVFTGNTSFDPGSSGKTI